LSAFCRIAKGSSETRYTGHGSNEGRKVRMKRSPDHLDQVATAAITVGAEGCFGHGRRRSLTKTSTVSGRGPIGAGLGWCFGRATTVTTRLSAARRCEPRTNESGSQNGTSWASSACGVGGEAAWCWPCVEPRAGCCAVDRARRLGRRGGSQESYGNRCGLRELTEDLGVVACEEAESAASWRDEGGSEDSRPCNLGLCEEQQAEAVEVLSGDVGPTEEEVADLAFDILCRLPGSCCIACRRVR
jgi:hypothetical protein